MTGVMKPALLVLLGLGMATSLPAQSDAIRYAVPLGVGVDLGLQFVPTFRDDNRFGPTLRIGSALAIGAMAKRDLFEVLWGALASEVVCGIWKMAKHVTQRRCNDPCL